MKKYGLKTTVALLGITLLNLGSMSHARIARPNREDLTQSDNAKKMLVHEGALVQTYNLGPTGMRGWMYTVGAYTGEAEQILVTKVDEGSPADGVVAPGDVILGIGETAFTGDPRMALADAITAAERETHRQELAALQSERDDLLGQVAAIREASQPAIADHGQL